MKTLAFALIVYLMTCSCDATYHVNVVNSSTDSSSLYYQGKPLYIFGKSIDGLTSKLTFYSDTLNRKTNGYSFLSTGTFFTTILSKGIMIGVLYIETNDLREIRSVYGHWTVNVPLTSKTEGEAIDTFRNRYLPNLPENFLMTKEITIEHPSFIETIQLSEVTDSNKFKKNIPTHWSFIYKANGRE